MSATNYYYDPVGNGLTKIEGGVTSTYSYDAANELTVEWTPSARTTYSGVHPERSRRDAL